MSLSIDRYCIYTNNQPRQTVRLMTSNLHIIMKIEWSDSLNEDGCYVLRHFKAVSSRLSLCLRNN